MTGAASILACQRRRMLRRGLKGKFVKKARLSLRIRRLEIEKWNNGAFTKALVEGLTGKADLLGKGKITINMLDLYLSERVKELAAGKQTPTTAKPNTISDFPIAVKK